MPGELETLLLACLAKRPEERPAAHEMAERLTSMAEALTGVPRQPAILEESGRTLARSNEASRAEYSMHMLGCIDLRSSEGSVEAVLRQPKRLALLAFLAAGQAASYQRRDRLVGVFLPDSEPESGRHSLRQGLYAGRGTDRRWRRPVSTLRALDLPAV